MNDEMMKMLADKAGKSESMSPEAVQAKQDVLKELLQMAMEAMGDKVKGGMDEMQKVSVMAPNKEDLTQGLDKAKDLLAGADDESEEDSKEEATETPAEEKAEDMPEVMATASTEEDDAPKKKMSLRDLMTGRG